MKAKILTLTIILLTLIACQLPGATLGELPDGTTAPTAPPTAEPPTPGDTPEPPKEPTPKPTKLCAIITADEALHLRDAGNEKADHIDYLKHGEQVTVLNPAGQWWKIETRAGQTGYANSKFMEAQKCQ